MALFGRKKKETAAPQPAATPTDGSAGPRLDRGALVNIIPHVLGEVAEANRLADESFGLATVEAWQLDLPGGGILLATPKGRWQGRIDFLGSHHEGASSWMWGWANERVSDEFSRASFGVYETGRAQSIPSLATMTLTADRDDAEVLAALAFGFARAQFLFRSDSVPVYYIAVSELVAV